jgi:hypothetical protein
MNIEIVEFYPIEFNEEKGVLTGTLRIKLPDLGLHILGIHVSKRKERWHFTLPGRQGIKHDTGELIRYPFITFENREKQKELMGAIREKGREFIEKRLSDKENLIVFTQKKEQEPSEDKLPAKEPITHAKPKSMQTIITKQWSDPPSRKTTTGSRVFAKK